MTDLLLPFQFPFMQNAFLIVAIVSVPAALLSCYLVLKGWALMGDAISHAVLPGIVIAYIVGIPLIFGAFIAGMACAFATGYLQENSRVKRDTIMGVVFSGMFGLGIVLFTRIDSGVHLDHILFGNMLGVGPLDLLTSATIAITVTLAIAMKWRDLLLHSFDPAQAKASGLNTALLHYGLLSVLSLTVVAALKAVGIILAISMLIAPGATAFLLTRSFGTMLWTSIAIALSGSLFGVYASFFLGSDPAPTIVLVMTAAFLVALALRILRTRSATRSG